MTIAMLLCIWLVGGNLYADYREQPVNRAIATYVRQHPTNPPNQTAIDLQVLMAKLGISIGEFGDGSKLKVVPSQSAIAEWKAIETTLINYLVLDSDLSTTEDSFQPVLAKLHRYLNHHQAEIDTIQNQLTSRELPNWDTDSRWVADSNPDAGDSWRSDKLNY